MRLGLALALPMLQAVAGAAGAWVGNYDFSDSLNSGFGLYMGYY